MFDIVRLHLVILIYSLSTLFAKLAGRHAFLSPLFIAFSLLMFFLLCVYAFLWQKVLGRFELSVAYASRAADLLWGAVFGLVFFSERVTVRSIASVLAVLCGIFIVVKSDG